MRKFIAIIIAILAIGGSAMAINGGVFSGKRAANNTTRTQQVAQPQADSLIDIATEAPVATPVVTEAPVVTATPAPAAPAATEAPVAEVVAEPVVVNEPDHNAMSFMDWLSKAQNTETGALNGIFDEERATRVNFVEEEISGYATFEVAGSYFSTKVEGYEFTAGHKSAGEATFHACSEHEGKFFDWTTRYNGDLVREEITPELVAELKEVAVSWQENGEIVYGILLCQHNSGSNAGNGGNGGEQPIVTPAPSQAPTNEPPATTPAPLPEAPEEEDVPEEEDPIVTQPPVENEPEYSDTEETTVPENEDPIIVGTPVDNTPTYNDESATAGKQENVSNQQAAPLMAAPLMEVESAPAQEQNVQVEDDPIVVTEPVQETSAQDMAPLMVPPAE